MAFVSRLSTALNKTSTSSAVVAYPIGTSLIGIQFFDDTIGASVVEDAMEGNTVINVTSDWQLDRLSGQTPVTLTGLITQYDTPTDGSWVWERTAAVASATTTGTISATSEGVALYVVGTDSIISTMAFSSAVSTTNGTITANIPATLASFDFGA